MSEEWRAVVGWEGLYEVSDQGRVRSLPRVTLRFSKGRRQQIPFKGRILSPALCNGYPRVCLKSGAVESKRYVHDLVCRAFIGEPQAGQEVAHTDGGRTNPAANNLRWATRLENVHDKVIHGTQLWGEGMHNAKLTVGRVRFMRGSALTTRAIAKMFDVSETAISLARRGKTWTHVKMEAA